ncbi:hypothetical protein LPJ66_000811 [Kickxella alabastrina]|uniref:Uncharacterized protein n=1 Tax=Kickxella alabastrina TaxID=61397 RepID=A0ACC1IUY7_9FUNG|nr:hypothetical protein LPJ66_000811 [Kickxella alabastrina]
MTMGAFTSVAPAASSAEIYNLGILDALDRIAAPQASASVQCQGDCQNENLGTPNASHELTRGIVRAIYNDFMEPLTAETPASDNHLVIKNTPVLDNIFNFINDKAGSEVKRVARWASKLQATTSVVAADADASATPGFDFNSWADRVDNAAHRLVNNVNGVAMRFLDENEPETVATANPDNAAPTASPARFLWF